MGNNEEIVLDILLNKYNETKKFDLNVYYSEFPDYMKFSIKEYVLNLKYEGLVSLCDFFIGDFCHIIITPAALQYYNKKGSRIELFDLMSDSDKELLKEIILANNNKEKISDLLNEKIENDEDNYYLGIISNLKSNGLISVLFADDKVYHASLTRNGRTYFEREKNYMDRTTNKTTNSIVNNYVPNGNIFMGDIINSSISINNVTDKIEQEINAKCSSEEEKTELFELLDEAKEILENVKSTNTIGQRKSFFKKIVSHLDTHGWFYAEIISLLGQGLFYILGGK